MARRAGHAGNTKREKTAMGIIERKAGGDPAGEGAARRRSALRRVTAAARELEGEGVPYRTEGRPALYRFAGIVLKMGSILHRSRHPETTGFYYRKGHGCVRDAGAYAKALGEFREIRELVNGTPEGALLDELRRLKNEYGTHAAAMKVNRSMGRGMRMNAISGRMDFLGFILALRSELGHVESPGCYVAALRRSG
jgi:hypothetical protein